MDKTDSLKPAGSPSLLRDIFIGIGAGLGAGLGLALVMGTVVMLLPGDQDGVQARTGQWQSQPATVEAVGAEQTAAKSL